jgi:hypothetical protein
MTTIARTPDLGLTLRLHRPGVAGTDCVPAIGQAGWWDPETGGYTAAIAHGSTHYWDKQVVWWAQVNGQLCCGDVTWSCHWDAESEGPLVVPVGIVPVGNALFVCQLAKADGIQTGVVSAGVLTVTATVRVGGAAKAVAPITLVIADEHD